jgi:3alpha(or 20beta)-hydroxysteroid dehydrogenase
VLVNNAAIVRFGPITETEPAAWRQVIDINLTGSYLGIRAVVSSMRKAGGGAIVNISSGAGMTGTFGAGAYVASKWGVRGMTKTAVLELGHDNIRVNSIHPVRLADGGRVGRRGDRSGATSRLSFSQSEIQKRGTYK